MEKKEEAEILEKIKNKVIKTGKAIREEVVTTIDGQSIYYDLMVRPTVNEDDQITGVACTATDITELRQARSKLEKEKDK